MPMVNSNRDEPPKAPCRFAPRDHNIYAHICRGKWRRCNPYAHMRKIRLDFFRAEPLYVLYIAGKNEKNVRCVRVYARSTRRFFTSFEQSMVGKIWQLELSNRICKKMEMV